MRRGSCSRAAGRLASNTARRKGPGRLLRRARLSSRAAFMAPPSLWKRRGAGPGELLQQFGIPVVRDMEGVGKHLHDHFNTYLVWRCSQKVTLNDLAASPVRKLMAGLQYVFTRSGHVT